MFSLWSAFCVNLICSRSNNRLILDHPGLENVVQIEKFQEKAYMEFQDYVTKVYPDDTYRCVYQYKYMIVKNYLYSVLQYIYLGNLWEALPFSELDYIFSCVKF